MTAQITRDYAEAFFGALATRDPERIEPFLDEQIDWLLVAPVELFPHCGQRFGKAAVLDAYQNISHNMATMASTRDFLLVDGETASILVRLTLRHRQTARQVNMRLAQFVRFRDGKAIECCAVIDSLGVAEQVLGHTFDLTQSTTEQVEAAE
jgi:ketosteroid isomerase-like protein